MITNESGREVRVIKLGGSLLDWPEFPQRFREWLKIQPSAANLLIVGGGDFVDVIRKLDEVHHLGETSAHWLCIAALRVSAALVTELLPECRSLGPTLPVSLPELSMVDVTWLMQLDAERSVRSLPASWEVTTDSIAARAAALFGASELVLLKSTLPAHAGSLRVLADAGYVDAHFPICAKSIPRIRLVNLRDSNGAELKVNAGPR
jgi:aspartokinase-like uncharacterized kinase